MDRIKANMIIRNMCHHRDCLQKKRAKPALNWGTINRIGLDVRILLQQMDTNVSLS